MLTKYPFYAFSILPSYQAKGGSNKTFKIQREIRKKKKRKDNPFADMFFR